MGFRIRNLAKQTRRLYKLFFWLCYVSNYVFQNVLPIRRAQFKILNIPLIRLYNEILIIQISFLLSKRLA